MALLGRIAAYFLVSTILIYATIKVDIVVPASTLPLLKAGSVALSLVLLFFAWRQQRQAAACYRKARRTTRPIPFAPCLTDCYVRFKGKLVAGDTHVLPLGNKTCAIYRSEACAEWETKKKKPGKGMETQRKPLLRDQAADVLTLVGNGQQIHIHAHDLATSWQYLRKQEKSQKECPLPLRDLAHPKYARYRTVECFARNGDTLVAQGKLTRQLDGRFFITATGRATFPFLVAYQSRSAAGNGAVDQIAGQAVNDGRTHGLNTCALLISASILLWLAATA